MNLPDALLPEAHATLTKKLHPLVREYGVEAVQHCLTAHPLAKAEPSPPQAPEQKERSLPSFLQLLLAFRLLTAPVLARFLESTEAAAKKRLERAVARGKVLRRELADLVYYGPTEEALAAAGERPGQPRSPNGIHTCLGIAEAFAEHGELLLTRTELEQGVKKLEPELGPLPTRGVQTRRFHYIDGRLSQVLLDQAAIDKFESRTFVKRLATRARKLRARGSGWARLVDSNALGFTTISPVSRERLILAAAKRVDFSLRITCWVAPTLRKTWGLTQSRKQKGA